VEDHGLAGPTQTLRRSLFNVLDWCETYASGQARSRGIARRRRNNRAPTSRVFRHDGRVSKCRGYHAHPPI